MRKEDFNNALNHIDYDLVEEFVVEKERMQKRAKQKRRFIKLMPIAACFVLVATFAVTVLPVLFDGSPDLKNEILPSVDEIVNEPPEGDESTGDAETEGAGPSYGKPDDEFPTPGAPSEGKQEYTFHFNGRLYTLRFDSREEMGEKVLSEGDVGSYITTVNVYDVSNDEEKSCRIFNNLSGDKIIVELFEGLYFTAE